MQPAVDYPRQFGKYMLLRPLATGGMAEVFLAQMRGHAGFDKACVDVSVPAGIPCSFDGACPAGQACAAPSPMTCSAIVGGPGHCFPICPE